MMQSFFGLLRKIIQTGIGKTRLIMATLGLGIAMLLLLLSIQSYTDFDQLLHSQQNENESADFLLVNKKITSSMME